MELNWIQRYALNILIRRESARLSELCPPDIANNLFVYHLDGLVKAKYLQKTARGVYKLTATGQKLAGLYSTSTGREADNIKTVIVLYGRTGDQYLLFRWSRQPYFGKVTLPHDRMPLGKSLQDGISSAINDKLGAEVPVDFKTSCLIRIEHDGELISHMNALVYQVDIQSLELPFVGRNGEAYLGMIDDVDTMSGLQGLVEAIESSSDPFEIIMTY